MKRLYRDIVGACMAPHGSVVCVGAFDGVHRGHQAGLVRVYKRSQMLGLMPIVVTFEPIPREFFARNAPMSRLTTAREKIVHFLAAGMQRILLLRFDAQL